MEGMEICGLYWSWPSGSDGEVLALHLGRCQVFFVFFKLLTELVFIKVRRRDFSF